MASPLEMYGSLRAASDTAYAAWRQPERPRIDVAIDSSALANGARRTLTALERLAAERGAAVDFGRNHGYGMQWLQPQVTITFPDGASVIYGPVTPADAAAILDEATGRWGAAAQLRVGTVDGARDGVASLRDHPYFALEPRERRLLRNLGLTDPESLEHYVARDGYRALARMLERHQDDAAVRQTLVDAGLLGRGGASFPTGTKWTFLATAAGNEHYLVCNCDEGDPGAWVNRVVIEGDPHLLVEGMVVGGLVTGSAVGFIYVRDEYPLGIARLEQAIAQAKAAGLLGGDILGTGRAFDLRVIRGAGAYVCGEETGLLSSIQDSRGMPRVKPPFPAQRGVFDKPSNVNNVESYANVPFILRHGVEWYREYGTERMRGTKIYSFSGDIERVGFMELAFGTPLAPILDACGGITDGGRLHAIQSGGPLGSLLPAAALPKLVLENVSFAPWDAIMGSGGIIFCSERTSVVLLGEMFAEFVEDESCGRCTTCHGGNQRQTEIVRRTLHGGGRREDVPNLQLLDRTLQSSNCVHGQFSPKIMRNILQHFRADWDAVTAGVDASLSIPALTRFRVADPRDARVEEAAAICPVTAFLGTPGRRSIDDLRCIRCGACTDVAPGAIVREAKPAEAARQRVISPA